MVSPILAALLEKLGVKTLPNPLGWFLLLTGVAYAAGLIIVYAIRKKRFWETASAESATQEERGDRSFWLITLGMLAVFHMPPVEFLYFSAALSRNAWMSFRGVETIDRALWGWLSPIHVPGKAFGSRCLEIWRSSVCVKTSPV